MLHHYWITLDSGDKFVNSFRNKNYSKLNMALFSFFRSVVFPTVKAEDEEAELVDPQTALRVNIWCIHWS